MTMRATAWTAAASIAWLGCGLERMPGEARAPGVLTPPDQATLDGLGVNLRLHVSILQNAVENCPSDARLGVCHDATLTIENQGPELRTGGWSIYWTTLHRALSVDPGELDLKQVSGSLHTLAPNDRYTGFAASESKTIRFQAEGCWIGESDALPRSYVAAPGLHPVLLANTDGDDPSGWFTPLVTEAQTACAPLGTEALASPESRFEANRTTLDSGAEAAAREIVPRPLEVSAGSGAIDMSSGLDVRAPDLNGATLALISERLTELGTSPSPSGRPVYVSIDTRDPAFESRSTAEAYRLNIAADAITIIGGDARGALHGVQSLLALLSVREATNTLPELQIAYDAPRYRYRGIQVDVARNFHGVPVLSRLLKQMAAYKLNALHLHLSDDEGFRLEIPSLPELTAIGARRCHDLPETRCLLPQLGSGPNTDTSGSGYFSRAEFVTLLRLATALSIEVIPELGLPGHARAAIRSMEVRAENGDGAYVLRDTADASEHRSPQGFTDNVVNPCLESTYRFAALLMDEVAAMYREAGAPLSTWHIGADEVPDGAWTRSPACEALFASSDTVHGAGDLMPHFLRRINGLALERGLGLRLWSDGVATTTYGPSQPTTQVQPLSDFAGNRVSVNAFWPLRYYDDSLAPLADSGYEVVITSADYLYLDHAQEPDPKERGQYWATQFTDLRKLFGFISGNPAANAALTGECNDFACDYFLANATAITQSENVIGLEAPEWSELIRTDEQLEHMLYPRLLAFAERAWHRAAWEPADGMDIAVPIDRGALEADWQRFAHAVGHKELAKLDRAGVSYRLDVPGARVAGGALEANTPLPGVKLEYQTPAGEFVTYIAGQPPPISWTTAVRSVTPLGRAGRAIDVSPP
jgi:hexosaminidase